MIVQDLFKNLNMDKFVLQLVTDFDVLKRKQKRMGKKPFKKLIKHTIKDFLSIKPILNDDVVITTLYYDEEDNVSLDATIVHLEDIKKHKDRILKYHKAFDINDYMNQKEFVIPYSVWGLKRKELLGYQFSNLSYEKYSKEAIASTLFFELTWFGYSNKQYKKNLKQEIKQIKKANKQIKKGKCKKIEFDDLLDDLAINKKEITNNEKSVQENNSIQNNLSKEMKNCIIENQTQLYEEYYYILENCL